MPLSQLSTPVLDCPEIASFLDLTSFMSTLTGPLLTTPKSAARRTMWAAYALATIVLVGMQPVLTHVPPNNLRSMIATFIPAPARRCARKGTSLTGSDDNRVVGLSHSAPLFDGLDTCTRHTLNVEAI